MSPTRRGRLGLHRIVIAMKRSVMREIMRMVKVINLSSISQVRQDESGEERAARLAQMRDHNSEVGNERNFVNDNDGEGDQLVIQHLEC